MRAGPRLWQALPVAAALLLGTPGLRGQAPDTLPPSPEVLRLEAMARRHARVAVSPHRHGTMVGVALRIPAGSALDPEGREGTAHLLARVRERQAATLLDPARAVLTARVERGATTWTLLATPEAWPDEVERLHTLLFERPVPTDLVAVERARVLEILRFEAGSPVEAFEREAASLLVEPGHPWASDVRGTPASVEALDAAGLQRWQEAHLRPEEATLALAGPVEALPGRAPTPAPAPRPVPADTAAPADTVPPPDTAAAAGPIRIPWRVGDRVALVQEVTSAWLSVAWPAPDSLPRTALELAAHLLEEELDPVPPDPDRYSVDVRVEDTPGGPVLLVQASLLPEALGRWEARILGAVERLAAAPMDEDFFRWRRRRFRTRRLLAEAAPEAEAARMARDLALLGEARRLDPEVWSLDPASLQATVRALGEPRILLLGPDLGQDGPDGAGGAPAR